MCWSWLNSLARPGQQVALQRAKRCDQVTSPMSWRPRPLRPLRLTSPQSDADHFKRSAEDAPTLWAELCAVGSIATPRSNLTQVVATRGYSPPPPAKAHVKPETWA